MAYSLDTAPCSERRFVTARGAVLRSLRFARAAFFCCLCLTGLLGSAVQPSTARAEDAAVAPIHRTDSPRTEIQSLLSEGRRLEQEKRWNEALTHYEEAARRFPGEPTFERRFEFARMNFELGRRYADSAFRHSLRTTPPEKSLDLYTEVLLKIESHYVDEPDWGGIVAKGTDAFEIALSRKVFLDAYGLSCSDPRIAQLQQQVRREIGQLAPRDRRQARQAVRRAAELAQNALGIPFAAVVIEYVGGAAGSLDPYSAYLTPGQLDDVYSQIEGNFVGLGIELKVECGELKVVRVIPRSPAEESGIHSGDVIVVVDGKATARLGTDEAANLLQGPEGTTVELCLQDAVGKVRTIRVRRRRVDVPSIDEERILDSQNGVAYMRLTCFQKTTSRDLDAALWKLHRAGMRKLILDLRGNPGGLLLTAVEVSDKFLTGGTIVATRGRDRNEAFTYTAKPDGTWHVPLIVLVDSQSASASEIFAGAIRDHHRGIIVGERSYGKGSVQGIFPLATSASGLRLTTAKFYSPAGRPYSKVGVAPDVKVAGQPEVEDGLHAAEPGSDPVVLRAVQVARGMGGAQNASVRRQRFN